MQEQMDSTLKTASGAFQSRQQLEKTRKENVRFRGVEKIQKHQFDEGNAKDYSNCNSLHQ